MISRPDFVWQHVKNIVVNKSEDPKLVISFLEKSSISFKMPRKEARKKIELQSKNLD